MHLSPQLSMIGHGKAPQNNLFSISMQLDEFTPLDEQLPHSFRLTLLQTAVISVPELNIVETVKNSCR